jgi:hypothetical protein
MADIHLQDNKTGTAIITCQVLQLVTAEGVAGHDHVNVQGGGHQGCDLPCVSVVPVHAIQLAGRARLGQVLYHALCVRDAPVCKLSDVRPQLLLPVTTVE